jgi:hypothetical protein
MSQATAPIRHTDRFYIGGQWVAPSSDAKVNVIDSDTEQLYFSVPEAQAADISRAVGAAREAFDSGPWPLLTHEQRAEYLRAIGAELKKRSDDIGQIWPRESGVLHAVARGGGIGAERTFSAFAALASTYPFEEPAKPSACRPASLTSSPPTARYPSCSSATRASTRSPSPGPLPPGGASPPSAASGSPAALSSPHAVPGRVLPVRSGLLLADPDRGLPFPARRAA